VLTEQLALVPRLANLGPLFKSSNSPVELTESETEYIVRCVKHTFPHHVVFQVSTTDYSHQLQHSTDTRVVVVKPSVCICNINKRCHTHTTVLRLSGLYWDNRGEPVQEETFTHSHLSWSSVIPYLLSPSITIHGIIPVQFVVGAWSRGSSA